MILKISALLSGVIVLCTSCASIPSQHRTPQWAESYFSQVRNVVEPIWGKKTNQEITKLLASGLTVQQLGSPENTVKIEFGINRSGRIENVQLLQESRYKFFNKVALNTIEEAGFIPPPPTECFKDDLCKIRWDFILKTK